MNQHGAPRGHEDDWWRQLYGEDGGTGTGAGTGARAGGGGGSGDGAVRDAGPSDASDTLDERVNSALRAVGLRPRGTYGAASAESTAEASVEPDVLPTVEASAEPAVEPAVPEPEPNPEPEPEPPAPSRQLTPHDFIGDRPPTYHPEPVALPAADPAAIDALVPDTTLDGAAYGSLTLRAASVRGDSARYRGEPRRDALLAARFGTGRHTLILVAVATGRPAVEGSHRAARDVCAGIGGAVGRSYTRLAEDIRTDSRAALKSGLRRLTDRSYGRLRGRAAELGAAPEGYTAALRCLLLPADPDCRTRVFFGVGEGGLFRLRDGSWQDLGPTAGDRDPVEEFEEPPVPGLPAGPYTAESAVPPEPFLFRASAARPGDTLLLCSAGLAEPLSEEPAFAARLAAQWSATEAPGLLDFLAAAQLRVKGHAKDRTAVGVWES
ncbi:protein phosphatase 2C domain-containing protein [Streptomyces piniterrae]|uniref:Protein phosphatase 2C domain-containing protein n=1 Tax=Streptomyces piniterrae TaxID=2571125 RepID=A0A4U0N733_9ACTN|nr:protein phosphatase 2C domain-containing protein [Streptomyces piniterrae]TJZ49500.1 protein phosphatase 2C domain-containing protein [Streptomyces piniterrae]